MKTLRLPLLFIMAIGLTSSAFSQTITEYFVAKIYDLEQTSGTGSTAGSPPYGFVAEVYGTGLTGTYTVVSPGGSVSNPQTLDIAGDLAEYDDALSYANTTALNAAYNAGTYTLNINTSGGLLSPTLDLTGDAFPNTFSITSLINGTWSGGKLLFDPTQDLTINFDAFSGFDSSSRIKLEIESGDYVNTSTSSVTSLVVPANTINLVSGATSHAEILFSQAVDTDNITIAGASGVAFYGTIVGFTVQAVPEPSTYAAIVGLLALGGGVWFRRRRV